MSLRSEFRIVMSVKNCAKTNVRFIFASSCLFFLRYLSLFAQSGVQHILCCVFVLFLFILCDLCCQFLWIVHFFLLPLRYSLTVIYSIVESRVSIYLILLDEIRSKLNWTISLYVVIVLLTRNSIPQ